MRMRHSGTLTQEREGCEPPCPLRHRGVNVSPACESLRSANAWGPSVLNHA
jgi:hypothetical protein